jgi:hypothetical protein
MRLRCDSIHAGHACSLILDWLGHHPGDHAAHDGHDLTQRPRATWPNDGTASAGVPVASTAAAPPRRPAPQPAPAPRRRRRYDYEITEWDLLPDA